jgi:putative oxidoreductase
MKRFFFDCGSRDGSTSLGFFILRVSTGLMMLFGHGIPKIEKFGELQKKFYSPLDYIPPQISLLAALGAEVVAASLLVLGLLTRPAAFVFGFAMVVAAFGYHANDPLFSTGGASREMAVLYLVPAVVLLLSGAGGWSLDAAIYKDNKRRRW